MAGSLEVAKVRADAVLAFGALPNPELVAAELPNPPKLSAELEAAPLEAAGKLNTLSTNFRQSCKALRPWLDYLCDLTRRSNFARGSTLNGEPQGVLSALKWYERSNLLIVWLQILAETVRRHAEYLG